MEMWVDGQKIAEVVPTSYTILKVEQEEITACGRKLSIQMMLTSNNDTLVVFKDIGDMLTFDGHARYTLGEELCEEFSKSRIQHMTKEITYSYKFKSVDFEKYFSKLR